MSELEDGVVLPISRYSAEEFDELRRKLLDKEKLDDSDLREIRKVCGLEDDTITKPRVGCDEYHAHGYKCVDFKSREAAVVERLVLEVRRYQRALREEGLGLKDALP
jgi:tryptophan 2,3-dioxygenase